MPKKILRTQKVIVPKGTIDPTDDTIIEIPAILHEQPVVIAKKMGGPAGIRSATNIDESIRSCKSLCSITNKSCADVSIPLSIPQVAGPSGLVAKVTQMPDLAETEQIEKEAILRQLEEFQKARRRFLVDASAVASKPSSSSFTNPLDFRDRAVMWGSTSTQTTTGSPISRPRYRDSIQVTKEHWSKSGLLQQAPEVRKSCFPDCKNLSSIKESKASIKSQDDNDSNSEEEGAFIPNRNSTFNSIKKEGPSDCNVCCSNLDSKKPRRQQEESGSDVKKKSMVTPQSSGSQLSNASAEFNVATHYSGGGQNNDSNRTSSCSAKLSDKSMRSLMSDSDFEKIKDQLRDARKKLDEAVAMVSRTVASSLRSSNNSGGRIVMAPETDKKISTPCYSSKNVPTENVCVPPSEKPLIPCVPIIEKPRTPATKHHDSNKCPLVDMTNKLNSYMLSKTDRSRSKSDDLLCLDPCSNDQIPPCKSRMLPQTQQIPARVVNRNNSNTACTPKFPCDIPMVSRQTSNNPPPPSTRSLPSSSTKIGERESQKKPIVDTKVSEGTGYPRFKETNDGNIKTIQPKKSDFSATCSTVCLNMDPSPCTLEETIRRKAKELENSLLQLSSSAKKSCFPLFPCEIPSSLSRKDYTHSSTTKSLPASSTRIEEPSEKIASKEPSKDPGYLRFSEELKIRELLVEKTANTMSKTVQTSNSHLDVQLCSDICFHRHPPPCKLEKVQKSELKIEENIPKSNSCIIECTPMLPCEMPEEVLEQVKTCVTTKILPPSCKNFKAQQIVAISDETVDNAMAAAVNEHEDSTEDKQSEEIQEIQSLDGSINEKEIDTRSKDETSIDTDKKSKKNCLKMSIFKQKDEHLKGNQELVAKSANNSENDTNDEEFNKKTKKNKRSSISSDDEGKKQETKTKKSKKDLKSNKKEVKIYSNKELANAETQTQNVGSATLIKSKEDEEYKKYRN